MHLILAFMACAIADGNCHEERLTFLEASPTPFTCMLYAQVELAKWDSENPHHTRKPGYRCGPPSRFAKI